MKTKSNKTLWIVLAIIIAAIAIFSVTSCLTASTEIKTSEFHSILNEMVESSEEGNGNIYLDKSELDKAHATQIKEEISDSRFNMTKGARVANIVFDGYVINFDLISAASGETLSFTTNYSRTTDEDALGMVLPATAQHMGYLYCKEHGQEKYLKPGESLTYHITTGILSPEESDMMKNKIAAL